MQSHLGNITVYTCWPRDDTSKRSKGAIHSLGPKQFETYCKIECTSELEKAMYPLWVVSMGSGEHPLQ